MKFKKFKKQTFSVKVDNKTLDVRIAAKPCLVTLFDSREVLPSSSALGPLGGLNLTGYTDYRLTLHLVGEPGAAFSIQEMFGPAGAVDQVKFEIGSGQIGPKGILNYRASFDIFGPKNLFIQVSNDSDAPMQVNGTLYAVR